MWKKIALFLFIASAAENRCFATGSTEQPASPYSLVLKTGKILKGTILSENDATIIIRDSDRVVISVKRTNVDAEATAKANIPIPARRTGPKKDKDAKTATAKVSSALSREEVSALIKKYQDQTKDPNYAERVKKEQEEYEFERAKR